MRFLDTVTIFHKDGDKYDRRIVDGCYWYGDTRISNSGNGIVRDDAITVFFPCAVAAGLKIHKKDHIIKGEIDHITSVNELAKYEDKITVLTVNENVIGSKLDNIVVSGK